jgi:hypothetical protein
MNKIVKDGIADIGGDPKQNIDVSSVLDIESELSSELDILNEDINDLSSMESDASLDGLDTELSGVGQ